MRTKTGWSLSEWITQAKSSDHFDSFKCYIIECFSHEERFIKIGRTFNTIEARFAEDGSLPYSYNILKVISDNPYRIFKLEAKLKRKFKEYRYQPMKSFSGHKECFSMEILNLIQDIE